MMQALTVSKAPLDPSKQDLTEHQVISSRYSVAALERFYLFTEKCFVASPSQKMWLL